MPTPPAPMLMPQIAGRIRSEIPPAPLMAQISHHPLLPPRGEKVAEGRLRGWIVRTGKTSRFGAE